MRLFLAFLLLLGCQKSVHLTFKDGFSTPRLEGYISHFNEQFDRNDAYPIRFVEEFSYSKPPSTAGVCYGGSNPRIEIKAIYQDSEWLALLVYHEMGHCSLSLNHFEAEFDIMNQYMSFGVAHDIETYLNQMKYKYENHLYGN